MKHLYTKVLDREIGLRNTKYRRVHDLYGDKQFVRDLDIVNELSGHTGCVNALCWSKSGELLASGSDDQMINIHKYLPQSSPNQFDFSTTISTGHRANIFSVKFMPYTNDRTIVSAAGDSEVRIFDIEYSGGTHVPAGNGGRYDGVRLLGEKDANCRVFRSHSDRVKRIVTEHSPWLFLTCSEDGEVRQWDLRQPESRYPAPTSSSRRLADEDRVPPPLISYKRYNLDLNSISCSPSQPHYIALGGAHLHCFLHDRRMTGRDRLQERGAPLSSPDKLSDHDRDLMRQATQCVRKFAPNGQKRMKRTDNGHITACKISDHNPNEMIVSWSGEWIYSFDLVRSPDADDNQDADEQRMAKQARESMIRKRKRARTGLSQASTEPTSSRPRTGSAEGDEEMSLMVHYENGQSEEIPIEAPRARSPISEAREAVLPESQRQSFRVSKKTVSLRKNLFTLGTRKEQSDSDPTGYAVPFTSVLGLASSILPEMDEISRNWRYPVNPLDVDVAFQNNLREKRGSARRFVQAAGTLARVLGGRLRTAGGDSSAILADFEKIVPAPREPADIPRHEQFGYDFLKAILLWLDSGVGTLLEGFTKPRGVSADSRRFPVPDDASIDAIDEHLIPYLLHLAGEDPILNIDTSPFEVNENRVVFPSEKAAVIAFAQALKIPFADLSSAVVHSASGEGSSAPEALGVQDRKAALRFWGFKVGRGVLMNAGQRVNFAFVDNAFGGLGRGDESVRQDEESINRALSTVDPESDDDIVESARLVRRSRPVPADASSESSTRDEDTGMGEDEDVIALDELGEIMGGPNDDDDEDEDHEASDSDEESELEDDDEDALPSRQLLFRSAFERTRLKEKVEIDKPCTPHTRLYRGHCNCKTVKDVNFFGMQDEYIVSGSDSGHVFIWDKKTSRIVNILEGDGEVVNVVQAGHPYEPMLAVSGIDHSIKIFSPDAHARRNARLGIGVSPADSSTFSSISFGRLRRRHGRQSSSTQEEGIDSSYVPEGDEEEPETAAPNGLASRRRMHDEYRITSDNDVNREGGSRENFITVSNPYDTFHPQSLIVALSRTANIPIDSSR
ncbi:WD and tetratricopeptide repeat-containing protein [Phyllosticta capitalensis]|uniref:WD repeat-containing protein n=1 Tax=Phyllosticta capitalensis TaxID=121624 RepID=UPI00312F0F3A